MRILVADDNVDSASSLATLLELYEHEVCIAHDGADALRLAHARLPDCAILDIGMPGLDGRQVCAAIRTLPGGDRIPVFAVSGWGTPDDISRSLDAGFNAHWVKPVDLQKLLLALNEAVEPHTPFCG